MCANIERPSYLCKATKGAEVGCVGGCKWPLSLTDREVDLELVPGCVGEYITVSHVWSPEGQLGENVPFANFRPRRCSWDCKEYPSGKMKSIANAILRIEREGTVRLWIDSICINQGDNLGKGKEVSKMGKIYENSKYTYALFSNELLALKARDLHNIIERYEKLGHECCKWESSDQMGFLRLLSEMCKDTWFSRCWTLQETLLSKKLFVIVHGHYLVDLKKVLKYGGGLIDCVKRDVYKSTVHRYQTEAEYYSNLQLCGYKERGHLVYVIHLMKNRNCERPEDIVYSMKEILHYGAEIDVVYGNSHEGYQHSMNRLVEVAVKHNDISFLFVRSAYQERESYIPTIAPANSFLSGLEHVVTHNEEILGTRIDNKVLVVQGWKVGKVVGHAKKPWPWRRACAINSHMDREDSNTDFMYDIQSGAEYIKSSLGFNTEDDDTNFGYGIGVLESEYNDTDREERIIGENTIEDLRGGMGTRVWDLIVKVEMYNGVNSQLSKKNCLICRQKVGTKRARSTRENHDGHLLYCKRGHAFLQAFGCIQGECIVVDIRARNWQGYPAFLVLRDVGNGTYNRAGVTRSSCLIAGGVLCEKPLMDIMIC